ncbi:MULTISPECIES: hypothetical protein [unclassified Nostoc]|uniref:hypothetical protein n=1 Tax=unclassified Nostoc TaxID=2593658 RepID=UPI002AD2E71B|nr:hypothetical protein [Nostoc sp. DedQUE03]MDZ7975137.1 hypothetical protein [Nostoc sp. DedQUE03]MDZ8045682.1 hypothetical protein [Nostoc sp. DedQUE02]
MRLWRSYHFAIICSISSPASPASPAQEQPVKTNIFERNLVSARDRGQELLPDQQAQFDDLVEAELRAATARTAALMQPENS